MAALTAVSEFWRGIGLPDVQRDLEAAANEVAARQEESERSRRRLVDQTRDFKKSAPEDARREVAALLKAYQAEVDMLSRRSKAAEGSLLDAFRRLAGAPDPYPALAEALRAQHSAQARAGALASRDAEAEIKKLRETAEEYRKELAEAKNQDITIAQLQRRVRELESGADAVLRSATAEAEARAEAVHAARERELHEQQIALATRLGVAEATLRDTQAALDRAQSEALHWRSRCDEIGSARASEAELIAAELERTQHQLHSAEAQVASLQKELVEHKNGAVALAMNGDALSSSLESHRIEMRMDAMARSSLEADLAAKEREITLLVNELHAVQGNFGRMRQANEAKVAALEDELSRRGAEIDALKAQVAARADYDEVRRELQILKSIEFADVQVATGVEDSHKTLEVLLLEKNRHLQSENTGLKNALSDSAKALGEAEERLSSTATLVSEQSRLIAQLEADLLQIRTVSSLQSSIEQQQASMGTAGLISTISARSLSITQDDNVQLLPVASGGAATPILAAERDVADAGILTIVASQRDRFRQRTAELEAENLHIQQSLSSLRNEIDAVRSDNVKLYEKIRFLETYQSKVSDSNDETLRRYHNQYEEGLNPFKEFSAKEQHRRYATLSPPEKATLNVGRFILANKYSRTFIFFYAIILHALVFVVLGRMSYSEAQADDCAEFKEHMTLHHPPRAGD